jgi:[ribosomal protein S5]-alanine N-acetyltransferase
LTTVTAGLLLRRRSTPLIETDRLILRLPEMADHVHWAKIRLEGEDFLRMWEPNWAADHFSRKSFRARVAWAVRAREEGRALPLFILHRRDRQLMGAITLDNIRRGPAQIGQVGYWIGPEFARQGYMSEALTTLVTYAFTSLDLSRIEAACLPENAPSRGLLEKCGFRNEGMARNYLQIAGRWRDHLLYANLRWDRRERLSTDEEDA